MLKDIEYMKLMKYLDAYLIPKDRYVQMELTYQQ